MSQTATSLQNHEVPVELQVEGHVFKNTSVQSRPVPVDLREGRGGVPRFVGEEVGEEASNCPRPPPPSPAGTGFPATGGAAQQYKAGRQLQARLQNINERRFSI